MRRISQKRQNPEDKRVVSQLKNVVSNAIKKREEDLVAEKHIIPTGEII